MESPLKSFGDVVAKLPSGTRGREDALARAETAGMPSADAEEWRYSLIDDLDIAAFAPVTTRPTDTDLNSVGPTLEGEWAAIVTVVDGWVTGIIQNDDSLVISADDETDLTSGVGTILGQAHDSLVEVAAGLAPAVLTIKAPRGSEIESPVLIKSVGVSTAALSAARISIVAEANAQLEIIEHQSSGPGVRLSLPLTELDLGQGARLSYTVLQNHGAATWQIANVAARVGQEATLTASVVALGGAYARVRTDCGLEGRGATGNLLAAYFGEGDQTLDFRTFQHHVAPDTHSDLLFKGAVGERSRSIYTGLITVGKEARGTNAFQTNRNLKLSNEAWAESVPNLEIHNNDVHCSHASTVGPIDSDSLFYLESRGVPPEVAARLVVAGFFSDVLERMPLPDSALELAIGEVRRRLENQAILAEASS